MLQSVCIYGRIVHFIVLNFLHRRRRRGPYDVSCRQIASTDEPHFDSYVFAIFTHRSTHSHGLATYTASARPEDMVPKSDAFPDARTHDSASKRSAGVPSTGADDKHVGSTKELPIPVAKGAGGQIPTSTLSPAKPEGTGKDTATDDKVRTATFPPAQLEPRKWTAWKGASAPGETPEEDLDLADNDVGGPPIDEEAYAKNLEVGLALFLSASWILLC